MATTNPIAVSWEAHFAREVQDRIFPSARPSIPNLDYYSDWRRARSVSGDYLDYFEVDEGNLCLAIGDIAGKGLRAAILTASLHSIVRALRLSPAGSLSNFVTTIDELFREVCPDHCYATLFVGRYDPVTGRLHYVNAGHEPPFVLRKSGPGYRTIRMESGGPVIGMVRHPQYAERVLTLDSGDLLVAYTDGLCEATNPRGEEWGWRRFVETVQSTGCRRARDIVEHVLDAEDEFAEGAPQRDDMTLWVGRVAAANSNLVLRAACEELVAA
jgi:sigma-B regulation protein RsbU (phosphoserine phosphatase)